MRMRMKQAYTSLPSVPELGGRAPSTPNDPAYRLRRARSRWFRTKDWDEHVDDMEQLAASAAFRALRDHILELAALGPDDTVLDVGAGTGLLALAAAPRAA